jgi:hypothetical protein
MATKNSTQIGDLLWGFTRISRNKEIKRKAIPVRDQGRP